MKGKKNKRRKGNIKELIVQKYFESQGYVVERARSSLFPFTDKKTGKKMMFSRSWDFFGIMDLICKKMNQPTIWVQVGSKPDRSTKMKQIADYPNIWNKEDRIELWCYCDRKKGSPAHWEVWWLDKNSIILCPKWIQANEIKID